jgi:hypothetical protein
MDDELRTEAKKKEREATIRDLRVWAEIIENMVQFRELFLEQRRLDQDRKKRLANLDKRLTALEYHPTSHFVRKELKKDFYDLAEMQKF